MSRNMARLSLAVMTLGSSWTGPYAFVLPPSTTGWSWNNRPCSACCSLKSPSFFPICHRRNKSRYFSVSTQHQSEEEEIPPRRHVRRSKILSAALLIAGITVGGGFLAIPTVVAPTGFFPAASALVGVWTFLGAQALVVTEILCQVQNNQQQQQQTGSSSHQPGMPAVAKAAFGHWGEVLIMALLVMVVEATLVSQISRAGAMMKSSYRVGCALSAVSVGAIVFGTPTKQRDSIIPAMNSLLTITFCTMAVLLFIMGVPAANWSLLSTPQQWSVLPNSIPTFLQLLVYGEILPTVCHYLNYEIRPIRWAIGIGSLLPLILEVGWAALGTGLGATIASIGGSDPVTLLLAAGPVQLPLWCLAISAILTTILGSYLALQSTLNAVWSTEAKSPWEQKKRSWYSAAIIVVPALAIASISPLVFLRAIDFAGSYPVLLLWGIAPPAIALKLRQQQSWTNSLPRWFLRSLLMVAIGLFSVSAIPDVFNLARWLALLAKGKL